MGDKFKFPGPKEIIGFIENYLPSSQQINAFLASIGDPISSVCDKLGKSGLEFSRVQEFGTYLIKPDPFYGHITKHLMVGVVVCAIYYFGILFCDWFVRVFNYYSENEVERTYYIGGAADFSIQGTIGFIFIDIGDLMETGFNEYHWIGGYHVYLPVLGIIQLIPLFLFRNNEAICHSQDELEETNSMEIVPLRNSGTEIYYTVTIGEGQQTMYMRNMGPQFRDYYTKSALSIGLGMSQGAYRYNRFIYHFFRSHEFGASMIKAHIYVIFTLFFVAKLYTDGQESLGIILQAYGEFETGFYPSVEECFTEDGGDWLKLIRGGELDAYEAGIMGDATKLEGKVRKGLRRHRLGGSGSIDLIDYGTEYLSFSPLSCGENDETLYPGFFIPGIEDLEDEDEDDGIDEQEDDYEACYYENF